MNHNIRISIIKHLRKTVTIDKHQSIEIIIPNIKMLQQVL